MPLSSTYFGYGTLFILCKSWAIPYIQDVHFEYNLLICQPFYVEYLHKQSNYLQGSVHSLLQIPDRHTPARSSRKGLLPVSKTCSNLINANRFHFSLLAVSCIPTLAGHQLPYLLTETSCIGTKTSLINFSFILLPAPTPQFLGFKSFIWSWFAPARSQIHYLELSSNIPPGYTCRGAAQQLPLKKLLQHLRKTPWCDLYNNEQQILSASHLRHETYTTV